jgi:hypothetical protein
MVVHETAHKTAFGSRALNLVGMHCVPAFFLQHSNADKQQPESCERLRPIACF